MNNKIVYIIGGGDSLNNFKFKKLRDKDTIVINKALFYISNPKYFITLDYTFLQKIKPQHFKKIKTTKIFIANFACPYLIEKRGQIIDSRYNLIYNLSDFNIIIKSYKKQGIGFEFNDFRNGDNSGYCALQLAILLGYEEINLLGIDLNIKDEKTHFHEGYKESPQMFKNKLKDYHKYFIAGLLELKERQPNIKIYSCSKISLLNNIIPYKEIT